MDSLLKDIRSRLTEGGTLPDRLPRLSFGVMNPNLTDAQRQAIEDFALKVAKPCLECHDVQHAALQHVKASQRTLLRAEFDHRAHITQRRCLECHDGIPVAEALAGDTTGIAAIDRAATQNIPRKENCIQCHSPAEASSTCVTCHFMHPNKDNRASLQLFVEKK
jgi:nitrate reductase cytochrome c-type subunit